MPRSAFLAVILVNWLAWTAVASGSESIRTQEIFQCRSNEVMTWGDGRDRPAAGAPMKFAYNPAGAPAWFPEELASGMVATAAAAWSLCGVSSQMVPWPRDPKRQKDLVLIQWQERESDGNFALANFKLRTLSLGPRAFELLKSRNPNYDSRETLQMVISHEMGHLFGLMAHSRRCVDVMSYYDNGKGENCYSRDPASLNSRIEYRNVLPTACDIERCRKANGKPPLPGGRLGAPALGGVQEAR